jgi:hypothetical protein
MACAICSVRRPKRLCPGVGGEICSICCGTEREMSVTCPLDCEYLQDARLHDKPAALAQEKMPHEDIRVNEKFLRDHDELLLFLAASLSAAALATSGAADYDVRDTLDALIRTYRTLETGVYYETVPDNLLASRVFRIVQEEIARFRMEERQGLGIPASRDGDILRVLVFFSRLELDRNNGRRRGRAFIGLLRELAPARAGSDATPRLVIP